MLFETEKIKKRVIRSLWISRINAASRELEFHTHNWLMGFVAKILRSIEKFFQNSRYLTMQLLKKLLKQLLADKKHFQCQLKTTITLL